MSESTSSSSSHDKRTLYEASKHYKQVIDMLSSESSESSVISEDFLKRRVDELLEYATHIDYSSGNDWHDVVIRHSMRFIIEYRNRRSKLKEKK